MGGRQEAWGDPVPFFELVLPPPAAKAAVPVLAVVTGLAIAGLVVRSPGLAMAAGDGHVAVANIVSKLELLPAADDHRPVLAVLADVRATA